MTQGNEFNGEIKLLNSATQVKTCNFNQTIRQHTIVKKLRKQVTLDSLIVPLLHQVDGPSKYRVQM